MPKRVARLLVLVSASLVACGPRPEPLVRIGLLVWPPYELFFLARDLGHYAGVPVELVDYGTPAEALRAYHNGVIDGVALTADFLLQVSALEDGHRAVLVINESHGGDVLLGQPHIKSTRDLVGQRVGLEMSTLGQFMLSRALASSGLGLEDVELRFVDIPDHEAAFRRGDVDAIVTYDPVRTRLLEDQRSTLLFDTTQIPNEIVDVLIVRQSVLTRREPAFRSLIDGYFRALDHLGESPDDAARRVCAREGLSPTDYLAALNLVRLPDRKDNQRLLGGDQPGLRTTLRRILPILVENHKVTDDLPLNQLTDDRLVRAR